MVLPAQPYLALVPQTHEMAGGSQETGDDANGLSKKIELVRRLISNQYSVLHHSEKYIFDLLDSVHQKAYELALILTDVNVLTVKSVAIYNRNTIHITKPDLVPRCG